MKPYIYILLLYFSSVLGHLRHAPMIFPKNIPTPSPYIVQNHRHVNVIPVFQNQFQRNNINSISLGLSQSINFLNSNQKGCQCENKQVICECDETLQLDIGELPPIVLEPPRLIISPCESFKQNNMCSCDCKITSVSPCQDIRRKNVCFCPCQKRLSFDNNYMSRVTNDLPKSFFNTSLQKRLFDKQRNNEKLGFPPEIFDAIKGFPSQQNTKIPKKVSHNFEIKNNEFNVMNPLLSIDTSYATSGPLMRKNVDKPNEFIINSKIPGEVLDYLASKTKLVESVNDRQSTKESTAGQLMNSAIDFLKYNQIRK